MASKLAREVAEASRVVDQKLEHRFVKTSHTDELVRIAKSLERLQGRRRKLRRELKTVDADIRRAKKELKSMARQISSGDDQ